jgi:predicted O-methyltransferase YrrM
MEGAAFMTMPPSYWWRRLGMPWLRAHLLAAIQHGQPWLVPGGLWREVAPGLWRRLSSPLWRAEEEARCLIQEIPSLADLFTEDDWQGGFGATPLTLLVLWYLLEHQKPTAILEMGSGLSTLLLARHAQLRAASKKPVARITSLDHDGAWLNQTCRRLAQRRLGPWVQAIHTPLERQQLDGITCQSYSPGMVHQASQGLRYDFCFIDGPPKAVGRVGSLPLVRPFLAPSATLLIDDAARREEQQAIRIWLQHYPCNLRRPGFLITSRGLARLRWKQPETCGAPAHA